MRNLTRWISNYTFDCKRTLSCIVGSTKTRWGMDVCCKVDQHITLFDLMSERKTIENTQSTRRIVSTIITAAKKHDEDYSDISTNCT